MRFANITALRRWGLISAVCLMASCSRPQPATLEKQIVGEVGEARSPVLSRDGTTIALAAVANGYTNPQIWVGRADGSAPPRPLTSGTFQNYDPEFSPDGRSIYFTSTRDPHGLYRVPSSGGEAELVIKGAFAAKFSPDGDYLLYSNGANLVERSQATGAETILLPSVANVYAPTWSPDGTHILITTSTAEEHEPEWWIAQAAGGEARKTSLGADLRAQGFNYIATNAWLSGDWIVFTGRQGETQTLWKVQLGADGRTVGKAVRATEDAEGDFDASFGAGKLIFARTRVDMNFWALSLDSTGEHMAGLPERLTNDAANKGQQSGAGSNLLFSAENGDRYSLYLKDTNQRDGEHTKRLRDGFYSVLSPDGLHYAFGEGTKEHLNVWMKSLSWWRMWPSKLCESCGMPVQFSRDGKKLFLWTDSPPMRHFDLLDVDSLKVSRIVTASGVLMAPRLSADGRWLSFVAEVGSNHWQAFVVSVSEGKEAGFSDWVPVTPVTDSFFFAFWSARNDLIYTLSSREQGGNLLFLDAQQLDPQTKRPNGSRIPVYQFDPALVPGMDPVWDTVSVMDGRIIVELGGMSTGVWMK